MDLAFEEAFQQLDNEADMASPASNPDHSTPSGNELISPEMALKMDPEFPWRCRPAGKWDLEGRWFTDGFQSYFERDEYVSEEE